LVLAMITELELVVYRTTQLNIPVTVVVHFKLEKRDIEITTFAQTIGANVGQYSRE
jgi:hypothetical protein